MAGQPPNQLQVQANVPLPPQPRVRARSLPTIKLAQQLGGLRLGGRPVVPNNRPIRRNPANPAIPRVSPPLTNAQQKQRWLDSEARWKDRVGKGWVAKKVLGKGSFGIVGHWSYEGADRSQKKLVDLVVKQGSSEDGGMRNEANFLIALNRTKSLHFPTIYRRLYVDQGQNTVKGPGNYDIGEVHRIFLEYCPGGDLLGWQRKRMEAGIAAGDMKLSFPTEKEMWEIFYCFSLALLAMDRGSEDSKVHRWDKEIVHFDIKQENLLFGASLTDTEHTGYSPLKVSDFGLSEDVVSWGEKQSARILESYRHVGTPGFYTPEQAENELLWKGIVRNQSYTTKSNVWQMGVIMWCLQHGVYLVDWEEDMVIYRSTKLRNLFPPGSLVGFTVGCEGDRDEERPDWSPPEPGDPRWAYSNELRTLIKRCLLIEPRHRPRPSKLEQRVREGYQNWRSAASQIPGAATQDISPAQTQYPDPILSKRWYSGQPWATAQLAALQRSSDREANVQPLNSAAPVFVPRTQTAVQVQHHPPTAHHPLQQPSLLSETQPAVPAQHHPPTAHHPLQQPSLLSETQPAVQARNPPSLAQRPPQPPSLLPIPRNRAPMVIIGRISKLTVNLKEYGPMTTREFIFRDIDSNITFAYLKDLLVRRGCQIPRAAMRLATNKRQFMDLQKIGHLLTFELDNLICYDYSVGMEL